MRHVGFQFDEVPAYAELNSETTAIVCLRKIARTTSGKYPREPRISGVPEGRLKPHPRAALAKPRPLGQEIGRGRWAVSSPSKIFLSLSLQPDAALPPKKTRDRMVKWKPSG